VRVSASEATLARRSHCAAMGQHQPHCEFVHPDALPGSGARRPVTVSGFRPIVSGQCTEKLDKPPPQKCQ
jgi:hypothetical protein